MTKNRDGYTAQQRAGGRIEIAIARLADAFPYHVAVLDRVKLVVRPDLDTMAVTVSGDDVVIYYNPEFALAITADELGGVLLHEVHHVIFQHVTADPAAFPDSWARTVAEEVTVNEFVKLPLPGEPVTLDRVPNLPPMESTRERYNRLKRVRLRGSIGLPQGASAGHTAGQTGAPGGPPSGGGGPSADTPAATPAGGVRGGTGHRRDRSRPAASVGHTVDDHTMWAEARRDPDRSRRAIRKVLRGALEEVGPHSVPASLMPELEALGLGQMEGVGAGTEAGGSQEALQGHQRGRLDWRQLLRRYVGQAVEVRPIFTRPPRRFPHLVGVVPGASRQAARPHILVVIDSSGSVTPGLLELIRAELAGLARRHEVTVVECDCVIQRVYRYRGRLETVQGRGGTDLCPPFEREFLRKNRAELLIYFTDGGGPAPAFPPAIPVIWCLVPGGEPPARWGRVVRMESPGGSW